MSGFAVPTAGMDVIDPALLDPDVPLDVPVPLGESTHGTRYRVVCIGCRQDVTISHGSQAPALALDSYRCLRCRS